VTFDVNDADEIKRRKGLWVEKLLPWHFLCGNTISQHQQNFVGKVAYTSMFHGQYCYDITGRMKVSGKTRQSP